MTPEDTIARALAAATGDDCFRHLDAWEHLTRDQQGFHGEPKAERASASRWRHVARVLVGDDSVVRAVQTLRPEVTKDVTPVALPRVAHVDAPARPARHWHAPVVHAVVVDDDGGFALIHPDGEDTTGCIVRWAVTRVGEHPSRPGRYEVHVHPTANLGGLAVTYYVRRYNHRRDPYATVDVPPLTGCAAGHDGECASPLCPQLRDGEPRRSGRHCPLDKETTTP